MDGLEMLRGEVNDYCANTNCETCRLCKVKWTGRVLSEGCLDIGRANLHDLWLAIDIIDGTCSALDDETDYNMDDIEFMKVIGV